MPATLLLAPFPSQETSALTIVAERVCDHAEREYRETVLLWDCSRGVYYFCPNIHSIADALKFAEKKKGFKGALRAVGKQAFLVQSSQCSGAHWTPAGLHVQQRENGAIE